ncbi:hypothetical protein [Knoellia sp. LjRoot47]|uniref:hypothetical protein n=1 Tax=Knoellia sp. LjRoot47 TaxID=3342330 RepID=UPI003ECE5F70
MRDVTPSATTPTRRLVTAGALGTVLLALTGCGIRLEDDAPRVPLVPTREPIEAEDALLRLLAAVQSAAVAPFAADPLAALLPTLHARQATVLHDALRQRGVPESALPSASPSASGTRTGAAPGATASPSSSASPRATVARRTVSDVESSVLAAAPGLEGAEADLRPALVALLGQVHAASLLSPAAAEVDSAGAASPTPTATPSPTPSTPSVWSTPALLAPLVTATRRATFLLEVAAARSPKVVRAAWLSDIDDLGALTADLVTAAGDAAPPPDLGQTLPRPVTTPAEARTLAAEAMTTLLASTGGALRGLTDAEPDTAFAVVPGWLGTVAAAAHRHGTRLTAFPGLA